MLSSSPQLLGENSVSLEQAIDYLQTAGKLPTFLFKVFQHSTMPALKLNHDRNFQPAAIEQVLLDFCIEHELIDPANSLLGSIAINPKYLQPMKRLFLDRCDRGIQFYKQLLISSKLTTIRQLRSAMLLKQRAILLLI